MTELSIWNDVRVAVCAPEGTRLADVRDIEPFLSEAFSLQADWLAVPTSRLGDDFLRLRTRLAGEATQKFATYRVGLAVIGDISAAVTGSEALAAYVRECNRGSTVWFLPTLADLKARLQGGRGR